MKKYTITFRKQIADNSGGKKHINLQIGRGYEIRNGHIDVIINSIPIGWEGKCRLWLDSDSSYSSENENNIEDETNVNI